MLKRWPKHLFFAALSVPLIWLLNAVRIELAAPNSVLGADPGEAVVHFLGEWALRMVLLAFTITPLYQLTRQSWIAQSRRMVGLWAFTYAVLHLVGYLFFYLQWSVGALLADLTERPYIIAGTLALLCLLPMAITSTRGFRRRMGRAWLTLHKLIYPAVGLAIVHLWWLTRDQYLEVAMYALWFTLLVLWRQRARLLSPALSDRVG